MDRGLTRMARCAAAACDRADHGGIGARSGRGVFGIMVRGNGAGFDIPVLAEE